MKKKEEAWIKAIPISQAHGSGNLQKKLWRLVSDFVRIRDWHKYGYCVATNQRIDHWKEGQAGHYKSYSVCRGMFKFDEENIHMQSAASNGWGGMDIGYSFGEELKRRGYDLDALTRKNNTTELKVNDTLVREKMEDIIRKMADLPEQPDYYPRVLELLESAKSVQTT